MAGRNWPAERWAGRGWADGIRSTCPPKWGEAASRDSVVREDGKNVVSACRETFSPQSEMFRSAVKKTLRMGWKTSAEKSFFLRRQNIFCLRSEEIFSAPFFTADFPPIFQGRDERQACGADPKNMDTDVAAAVWRTNAILILMAAHGRLVTKKLKQLG